MAFFEASTLHDGKVIPSNCMRLSNELLDAWDDGAETDPMNSDLICNAVILNGSFVFNLWQAKRQEIGFFF